jgi:hypothetical protein
MATIIYPQLSIEIDRAGESATISVGCDLDFSEFEVKNMNLLGLRYSLQCQLLEIVTPRLDTVLSFDPQQFPRFRDGATAYEHAVFETAAAVRDLHLDLSGKSSLVAELVLTNEDLGTVDMKRTQVVGLHLPV